MILGGGAQRAFTKDRYIPCDVTRNIPIKIAIHWRRETLRSIGKELIGEDITNKYS